MPSTLSLLPLSSVMAPIVTIIAIGLNLYVFVVLPLKQKLETSTKNDQAP